MSAETSAQSRLDAFRIIHGALMTSAVVIAGICVMLVGISTPTLEHVRGMLRGIAALELLGVGVALRVLRDRLSSAPADGDPALWWRSHGGRAVTIWALGEATVLVGGVLGYVAGDWLILAPLAAFGLGILGWNSPRRLMSR